MNVERLASEVNYDRCLVVSGDAELSMCAAQRLRRVFRCCVTTPPPHDRQPGGSVLDWTTHDDDDVDPVWSSVTRRYLAGGCCCCAYLVDDPRAPVPVCCCERCDGGWFPPPEVMAVRLRRCLLACDRHVTTGKTNMSEDCAWTGDVTYLDDVEKSEMSLMSRDFKGVHLLIGHGSRREEDGGWPGKTTTRPPWSPRSELVGSVRPPNRTIGHVYDALLVRYQRTCAACHLRDVTDDAAVTRATSCCCSCCGPSVTSKRARCFGWPRKKKS